MLVLRRLSTALALTALLASAPGCYHYHVTAPRPDPATEYKKRTTVALLWGFVTKNNLETDCIQSNALDEVWVQSNFGYSLVTIVTLGIVAPLQVSWRCAKKQTSPGTIGQVPHE